MISLKFLGIFSLVFIAQPQQWQQSVSAHELEQAGQVTGAAKLLRKLGYEARNLEFTTKDGYILNIVRATNPLFAGVNATTRSTLPSYPILFVHGTFMGASTMLGSTEGARPRNFRTKFQLRAADEGALEALLKVIGEHPSGRSLPLLALNLGYEIWLLNRRGSEKSKKLAGRSEPRTLIDALVSLPKSLNLLGGWLPLTGRLAKAFDLDLSSGKFSLIASLSGQFWSAMGMPKLISSSGPVARQIIDTIDPEFWSSSLDEQIAHDLPGAVDFVLEQTGKSKVHTVGYSSGGALILLAAAEQQKLVEKVASAVLWSPSTHMNHQNSGDNDLAFLAPLLAQISSSYVGPVPPAFVGRQFAGLAHLACDNELAQRTICSRFFDFFFGYSGLEAPVIPQVLATGLQPVSSRELIHLSQMASSRDGPCKFRFSTSTENIQVYGQRDPPCYKLERVNLTNLFIYVGEYDTLISQEAVKRTVARLKDVKSAVRLTIVGEPGVHFNHAGPLFHDEVGRLLILPSLLDIERVDREARDKQQITAKGEHGDLNTCPSPAGERQATHDNMYAASGPADKHCTLSVSVNRHNK